MDIGMATAGATSSVGMNCRTPRASVRLSYRLYRVSAFMQAGEVEEVSIEICGHEIVLAAVQPLNTAVSG